MRTSSHAKWHAIHPLTLEETKAFHSNHVARTYEWDVPNLRHQRSYIDDAEPVDLQNEQAIYIDNPMISLTVSGFGNSLGFRSSIYLSNALSSNMVSQFDDDLDCKQWLDIVPEWVIHE